MTSVDICGHFSTFGTVMDIRDIIDTFVKILDIFRHLMTCIDILGHLKTFVHIIGHFDVCRALWTFLAILEHILQKQCCLT
jgi:hypothetical protein